MRNEDESKSMQAEKRTFSLEASNFIKSHPLDWFIIAEVTKEMYPTISAGEAYVAQWINAEDESDLEKEIRVKFLDGIGENLRKFYSEPPWQRLDIVIIFKAKECVAFLS